MPTHHALAHRPSHAVATEQRSPRNRVLALLLCVFFGIWGIHRFYVGKWFTGLIWFLTAGLFGFGWIYDIVMLAIGRMRDDEGRVLGPPQYEVRELSYQPPSAPPRASRRQQRKADRRRSGQDGEPELAPVRGEDGSIGYDDELMRDPLEDKFAELEREMRRSDR